MLPAQDAQTNIRVDFIFSFSPYEEVALKRVKKVSIGRYAVKFASVEDIIIHKMLASRAVDIEDVKNILLKNMVNSNYIKKWLLIFRRLDGHKNILIKFNFLSKDR